MTKKSITSKKILVKRTQTKNSRSLKSRIQSAIKSSENNPKPGVSALAKKEKKVVKVKSSAKSLENRQTENSHKKTKKKRIPAESLLKTKINPLQAIKSVKKEVERTSKPEKEAKKINQEVKKKGNIVKVEEEVAVKTRPRVVKSSRKKGKRVKTSAKDNSIEIEINLPKDSSKSPEKKKGLGKHAAKVENTIDSKENISIEIDNIIKKLENKKKLKERAGLKEKIIVAKGKKPLQSNVTLNKSIVNLKEINSKSKVSTSDFILAITEISLNSQKYGIEFLNKSKFFWEAVTRLDEFKNIFLQFKPETLRKYWRFISENDEIEKMLETVKKFKNSIDESETKLLTVISIIREFTEGKIKDLEDYLKNYSQNNVNNSKFRSSEEDDVKEEGEEGKLIGNKRKRQHSPTTKQFHGINFILQKARMLREYYQQFHGPKKRRRTLKL